MAESVQGRWGYNNDEVIQKRAHSGSKEDEAEAYKILGWKDKVSKSRIGWLTWLNHVQLVIYKSRDYDITSDKCYILWHRSWRPSSNSANSISGRPTLISC